MSRLSLVMLIGLFLAGAVAAWAGERGLGTTTTTSGSMNNRDTAVPFSIENGTLLSVSCNTPANIGVGVTTCTADTCVPLVTQANKLYPTSCTYPLSSPYSGYSKCVVTSQAMDGGASTCKWFQRYGNEGATRARGESDSTVASSLDLQSVQGPVTITFDGGLPEQVTNHHYALYLTKGADMSGGVQDLGICFSDQPAQERDGFHCDSPSFRVSYLVVGSDGAMHVRGHFSNDTVANLLWAGNITIGANGGGVHVMAGMPTTSLPYCGGGNNAGSFTYDTTIKKHVGCDGISGWQAMY